MRIMPKIDLKKELKTFYTAPKKPELVDVPPMNFLMIEGKGDPNREEFQQAMGALYSVAYALKFNAKKAGKDFTVMPPEGLFWTKDMSHFNPEDKTAWEWTLMISQPEFIAEEMFRSALEEARKKKDLAVEPRLEAFHEGLSAQIMHIGPYAAEAANIEILHNFIRENGYQFNGRHHEIYLSDPRRAAPEKMKTIIRQPVKK
jgi:hypothetical protein